MRRQLTQKKIVEDFITNKVFLGLKDLEMMNYSNSWETEMSSHLSIPNKNRLESWWLIVLTEPGGTKG